jgi:hypothetical protein
MGTESCFLLMAASDPSQKMTSSNLHIYTYANLHKRNGHFLPRLGSRMVRLSTSALPAQGSVSCNAILTDYQGSVSLSMDNGVLGLTSWLRVLSAQSIEGGSGEVTRHRLTDHLSFHLLHGWGKYPLIGNKILVTCSQICYHRGENRWVGWVRLTIPPSHPRQVLTRLETHPTPTSIAVVPGGSHHP